MKELKKRIQSVRKQITQKRTKLIEARGAKAQLLRVREIDAKKLVDVRDEQALSSQANLFLLSEVTERREQAVKSIEQMGTVALQQIYGPGYRLIFETFEEKRKTEGASNFRMEIKIGSPQNGSEVITGLVGHRGGGGIEVVAFALRMAALQWLGYKGPILLDEAWHFMSSDVKIEEVAKFLREITDETGRQVIFVTHKADVFKEVADRVVQVTQDEHKLAQVKVIQSSTPDMVVVDKGF